MATIANLAELKTVLRSGPYTDMGGYPLYFITSDGAALSFDAVRERFREVCADMMGMSWFNQWKVVAVEINYEDPALFCDHTGKRIPSAYAEDDAEEA